MHLLVRASRSAVSRERGRWSGGPPAVAVAGELGHSLQRPASFRATCKIHIPRPTEAFSYRLYFTGSDKQYHLRSNASDRSDTSDRKSTRLNSSHLGISYAVFC